MIISVTQKNIKMNLPSF